MIELAWNVAFAALGVLVPAVVALYEFAVKGRKRLGYRVQMDTTATDVGPSRFAGALQQLQENGTPLNDPTLVLLRIENNGATNIDTTDYAVLDDDKVGLRASFPGRRVAGVVVTELSHDFLRPAFEQGYGLGVRDGVIELPKVPLNKRAHYKVLAALEREPGSTGTHGVFEDPKIIGGIKGGVRGGRIEETRSRTGTPRRVFALSGFLVLIILAQLLLSLTTKDKGAVDCASGRLTVVGSTAFEPVVRAAGDLYRKTCPDAEFTYASGGSAKGLRAIRDSSAVAFSDGPKPEGYPKLVPRPIALALFTLVVNPDAGVEELSLTDIRRLYRGEITNWAQVGGDNRPVVLVSRDDDSGTRTTFRRRVLADQDEKGTSLPQNECRPQAGVVVRCERGSTRELLDTVAGTAGAIGYSELGAAQQDAGKVLEVLIDGQEASLTNAEHGAYPYWETEYAYTWGNPDPAGLAASFLRYLTKEVGQDVVRQHGDLPCTDLNNPATCQPATSAVLTGAGGQRR